MPLLQILLAVFALGLSETGVGPLLERPWVVLFLGAVPLALRPLALSLGTRGYFRRAGIVVAVMERWPSVAFALAVLVFGWHAAVLEVFGVPAAFLDWPHPALLVSLGLLLPYQWIATRELARLADRRPEEVAARLRARIRQLCAAAFPLVFFVGVGSVLGQVGGARVLLEEVALAGAVGTALSIGLMAALAPFVFVWALDTVPLAGRDHGWQAPLLSAAAREAGLRHRGLRLWRTGQAMANAAVVGFAPFHRFVLFTDHLLAQLGPRELVAVFAHEAGHARRHHVAVFASWAIGFLLVVDWGLQRAGPAGELFGLVGLALAIGLGGLGFGYLSRRIELDADLAAVELTGDPVSMGRALRIVGSQTRRSSWRHFSVERRIEFLGRVTADPAVGRGLRARLRVWVGVGALLLLAGVGLQAADLAERLPEDLVRADLRRGRFAAALARAEELVPEPPEATHGLLELARFAAGHAELGASGDKWAERAQEALAEGAFEEARGSLLLAVLLGRGDLAEIVDALAEERFPELDPPWDAFADAP